MIKKLQNKIKVPIDDVHEASWRTILVFSILDCLYVLFINLVAFRYNIFTSISDLTLGLINGTLIANIIGIIIFVFIIIFKYGKLSFFDVGLKKDRLFSAIVATFTLWISMQLLNIIGGLIISGKPIIHGGWNGNRASKIFGNFIAQLFGTGLFEEITFRGFLLIQISKKFEDRKTGLFSGIIISQLLFALIHIPNRIFTGMDKLTLLTSLVITFMIGILFVTIYLATDNIFLAAGLHTLWNMPLPIFVAIPDYLFMIVAIAIILLIWDRSFGRLSLDSLVQREL